MVKTTKTVSRLISAKEICKKFGIDPKKLTSFSTPAKGQPDDSKKDVSKRLILIETVEVVE